MELNTTRIERLWQVWDRQEEVYYAAIRTGRDQIRGVTSSRRIPKKVDTSDLPGPVIGLWALFAVLSPGVLFSVKGPVFWLPAIMLGLLLLGVLHAVYLCSKWRLNRALSRMEEVSALSRDQADLLGKVAKGVYTHQWIPLLLKNPDMITTAVVRLIQDSGNARLAVRDIMGMALETSNEVSRRCARQMLEAIQAEFSPDGLPNKDNREEIMERFREWRKTGV